MTARKCIKNTARILQNKKGWTKNIINILLNIDNLCNFSPKQEALLKSDVINVLDEFYSKIENKERINSFIKGQIDSISPKTKKLAKEFILKYNI